MCDKTKSCLEHIRDCSFARVKATTLSGFRSAPLSPVRPPRFSSIPQKLQWHLFCSRLVIAAILFSLLPRYCSRFCSCCPCSRASSCFFVLVFEIDAVNITPFDAGGVVFLVPVLSSVDCRCSVSYCFLRITIHLENGSSIGTPIC